MLDRRQFAQLSIATLAASAVAQPAARPTTTTTIIKPKRLSAGDTVGLVAPASAAMQADDINFARDQMKAIGFNVVIGAHAFDKWGYFAGHDRDRAADINAMFADPNVAGIVCYTGGWGAPRVLPYLDYEVIRRNPKVFIGYSDVTALLNAIHKRTGLVTFHGPVGESVFDPYTLDNVRRVIMTAAPAGALNPPPKKANELVDRVNRIVQIAPGKASARLIGGNLTLVSSLMGTPYELDTTGALLFLEDVHEEPYRIDRMLTQLALGGKLDHLAGLIWGRCSQCEIKGPTFSMEEILRDRFGNARYPAISGLSFGHIEQKLVMPIGVMATLDADAGTVSLDEAAVT